MPNGNGIANTLQNLFSDNDFISLSPQARRETLRQIVPELRGAPDATVDQFATGYGGKNFQQMTDPNALPGNLQTGRGAPVTNAYGITGPIRPTPGETFATALMREKAANIGLGEQRGLSGMKELVKLPGESDVAFLQRAIQYAGTVTPQQIQQETQANKRLAPFALAAGPTLAAAQLSIPAAASALTAPTVAGTTEAGTGILDAAGNQIMREVEQAGPSLGRQALQSTLSWVGRHKLLSAAVYEGARRAGVPVPNVIGWLTKAAGEAK